jgi:cytochrome c553
MDCTAKLLAIVTLVLATQVASQTNSSQPTSASTSSSKPSPGENYVGDDKCRSCHQDKVESFHQTAHYLTSRLPDRNSIRGSFSPDANVLKTSNPDLFFRMEAKDGGFFQTAIQGEPPYTTSRSERFCLVVGSGGKGQTFLFWKGALLFQLPVSYWNEVGWVNSPGYRDGVAYFDRPVIARCLECHGTYFESLARPANRYRETGFVTGIT